VATSIGIHTGQCQIGPPRPSGPAVDIALALSGMARPGEVLTSRTVRDLVAGSGLLFSARGSHPFPELGECALFGVV